MGKPQPRAFALDKISGVRRNADRHTAGQRPGATLDLIKDQQCIMLITQFSAVL